MLLREYNIEGTKYNVDKIRHYTTMKGLLSILKLGYLRPHKSKGDRDYSFLSDEEKYAVSFLDSNIDTEYDTVLYQNFKQGTIANDTYHLALHMHKIAVMIEIDLNKYKSPEDIKLMSNFKNNNLFFIDNWNQTVEWLKVRERDINLHYEATEAYKTGDIKTYNDCVNQMSDSYQSWFLDNRKPGTWGADSSFIKSDKVRYEDFKKYKFKPMTDAMKAQLKSYCDNYDITSIYKFMMRLGFDKSLIMETWKHEIPWSFPQRIHNAISDLRSLMANKGQNAPVELRSFNKVYLNKDSAIINVFLGLVKGTDSEDLLPEVKQYEKRYNIQYREPGWGLSPRITGIGLTEKTFVTANKLSFEDACKICSSPKRFIRYIQDNKSVYWNAGEFDKVESVLSYIPEVFFQPISLMSSDFINMVQEYIREILPLGDEEDVDIYRFVRLDKEEDFDWSDIGNCWCYDWDSALEFGKYFTDESKNPFLITASTPRDNVDWLLSICLNMTHINEKELRLYDPNLVEDPYLEEAEYYMKD